MPKPRYQNNRKWHNDLLLNALIHKNSVTVRTRSTAPRQMKRYGSHHGYEPEMSLSIVTEKRKQLCNLQKGEAMLSWNSNHIYIYICIYSSYFFHELNHMKSLRKHACQCLKLLLLSSSRMLSVKVQKLL